MAKGHGNGAVPFSAERLSRAIRPAPGYGKPGTHHSSQASRQAVGVWPDQRRKARVKTSSTKPTSSDTSGCRQYRTQKWLPLFRTMREPQSPHRSPWRCPLEAGKSARSCRRGQILLPAAAGSTQAALPRPATSTAIAPRSMASHCQELLSRHRLQDDCGPILPVSRPSYPRSLPFPEADRAAPSRT